MDLVEQLAEIISAKSFDYIVIEASGICEPAPIAQTISTMRNMGSKYVSNGIPSLDCIVTVVDALRMQSEFAGGEKLTRKNLTEDDIENLIIEQVEFCNIILLNKISEVSRDEASRIKAIIRALQPKAKIIECDYCDIDLSEILNTGMFNFDKVATSAAWIDAIEGDHNDDDDHDEHEHEHHHHNEHDDDHGHHHHHHHGEGEVEEYGIQTYVYYRREPFDINRFDYFIHAKWPSNIIRAKGILYFRHNTDMSYIFEQAGSQKKLTEAGYWYATAPEDELRELMQQDPSILRDWDDKYGDRMIKLVFIGQNLDRKALEKELDCCLAK